MATIVPDEGLNVIMGIFPMGDTALANLYIGFFTSQTASTVGARTITRATMTEATGTAYARQTLAAATWGALADNGNGRKSIYPQITFPTVGAAGWGTINGFALFDAATLGNLIYQSNFDDVTAIVSAENDIIKVTPTFQMDGV